MPTSPQKARKPVRKLIIEGEVITLPDEEIWVKALPQEPDEPAMCAIMRDENEDCRVPREVIIALRNCLNEQYPQMLRKTPTYDGLGLTIVEEDQVGVFMREHGLPKNKIKEEVCLRDEKGGSVRDLEDVGSEPEDGWPLAPWEVEEQREAMRQEALAKKAEEASVEAEMESEARRKEAVTEWVLVSSNSPTSIDFLEGADDLS